MSIDTEPMSLAASARAECAAKPTGTIASALASIVVVHGNPMCPGSMR